MYSVYRMEDRVGGRGGAGGEAKAAGGSTERRRMSSEERKLVASVEISQDSTQRAVPDVAAHVGSSSTRKRRRREEADAEGAGASNNKKPRSVCPHQRQRSRCKECGGASICQH